MLKSNCDFLAMLLVAAGETAMIADNLFAGAERTSDTYSGIPILLDKV